MNTKLKSTLSPIKSPSLDGVWWERGSTRWRWQTPGNLVKNTAFSGTSPLLLLLLLPHHFNNKQKPPPCMGGANHLNRRNGWKMVFPGKRSFSWGFSFVILLFCECVCFSFQSNLAPCWVMTSIAKYNATHVVFLKKKRQLVKLGIAGASAWWWKSFFSGWIWKFLLRNAQGVAFNLG